jgi:hypothetical protein
MDDPQDGNGDPDATVQITFLMGELYGKDDPIYLKGRELFERHLDECAQDVEWWRRGRECGIMSESFTRWQVGGLAGFCLLEELYP